MLFDQKGPLAAQQSVVMGRRRQWAMIKVVIWSMETITMVCNTSPHKFIFLLKYVIQAHINYFFFIERSKL